MLFNSLFLDQICLYFAQNIEYILQSAEVLDNSRVEAQGGYAFALAYRPSAAVKKFQPIGILGR